MDKVNLLVQYVLATVTYVWNSIVAGWGIIGIFVIGLPVLRKVVNIFRRILHG